MCLKAGILLILLITGLWCDGCSRSHSTSYTLPSGKQIKITSMVPMHFPNGEDALVLNYETDISIDDKLDLRKEVDQVWGSFKKNVESANMTNGIIRVVHQEGNGFLTHGKGYGFLFVKRADGEWHCLQDEKNPAR
jgi:hypothetical protein